MRRFITSVIYLIVLISFPVLTTNAGGLGSEKLLWEANQLFNEYKDAEALEKFELLLTLEPDHQEALFKSSLLCGRIGNRYTDETHKNLFFQKGLAHAQRALQVDSTQADAHYANALLLGYLCQTGSLGQRVNYLVLIKKSLDKALAINPDHSGAWHLMGRWSYKVANLTFGEKAASKVLMQTSFPVMTNEQSIEALTKAITLDPNNLLYYYDLARVQRDAMLDRPCVETLQKALDQKLVTAEDLELSRKCKMLLQEILKVKST